MGYLGSFPISPSSLRGCSLLPQTGYSQRQCQFVFTRPLHYRALALCGAPESSGELWRAEESSRELKRAPES
eukprot:6348022-Alexandrium_andersonii.AAC.1